MYSERYNIQYTNIAGDSFEIKIFHRSGLVEYSEPTPLQGSAIHSFKRTEDIFKAVRGSSLTINIEASTQELLEAFSNFQELDYLVEFFRNGNKIFKGFVKPEGYYQDWVSSKWQISMTATDGMGDLKNTEFSPMYNPTTGGLTGEDLERANPREFNYLYLILETIGYRLPIVFGDDINTNSGNLEWTLHNRRIFDERVFINRNDKFLDCETIIEDLLGKYNLTISQANIAGELSWLVFRTPLLAQPVRVIRKYDYNYETEGEISLVNEQLLTNEIKNYNVFSDITTLSQKGGDAIHCNENQQITFLSAIQNFRFETNWLGLRNMTEGILEDWTLEFTSEPNNYFFNDANMVLRAEAQGFTPDLTIVFQTEGFNLPTKAVLPRVSFEFQAFSLLANSPRLLSAAPQKLRYAIFWTDPSNDTFSYNQDNGEWQDNLYICEQLTSFEIPNPPQEGVFNSELTIDLPEVSGGKLFVVLLKPTFKNPSIISSPYSKWIEVNSFSLNFLDPTLGIGKHNDSKQKSLVSKNLDTPTRVINSNEENAYFLNNLYRVALSPLSVNGLIPMQNWRAIGTPSYVDLLELTSIERLRLKARPQKQFKGDIFGYIPYLGLVQYNGVNGVFMPTEYNYITADNVIELTCTEFLSTPIAFSYEKSYIFENENNVLIDERG